MKSKSVDHLGVLRFTPFDRCPDYQSVHISECPSPISTLLHCFRVNGSLDSVYCYVKSPSISGSMENRPKTFAVSNPLLVLPEYIITVECKVSICIGW